MQCIAEELLTRGDEAILPAELLQAVSHRIIGFEILTAPFVIAQLQMYLLLSDMGLPPPAATRPAIFLTNALTGWEGTDQIKLNFPELQQEHDAAREVKRGARIIVILGGARRDADIASVLRPGSPPVVVPDLLPGHSREC